MSLARLQQVASVATRPFRWVVFLMVYSAVPCLVISRCNMACMFDGCSMFDGCGLVLESRSSLCVQANGTVDSPAATPSQASENVEAVMPAYTQDEKKAASLQSPVLMEDENEAESGQQRRAIQEGVEAGVFIQANKFKDKKL